MSFVGMVRVGKSVLAFGDVKGTIVTTTDVFEERRRYIKKVFKNNYMFVATYGSNEIGKKRMEDVLKEIVTLDDVNFWTFVERIEQELKTEIDVRHFEFIIYVYDQDEILLVSFDKCKMSDIETTRQKCYVAGSNIHIYLFTETISKIPLSVEKPENIKSHLTDVVKKTNDLLKALDVYSSVSDEIVFEEVQVTR